MCGRAMQSLFIINSECGTDTNHSSTSPLSVEQYPEKEVLLVYVRHPFFRESSSFPEALHTRGISPVVLEAADQLVFLVTGLGQDISSEHTRISDLRTSLLTNAAALGE